jgi:hypothetical protein
MAQEYDEIVEVQVDQQTTALAEPSFSIAAIVALFDEADIPGWAADQRAKYYATDSEMGDDGFPVDHIARVKFRALVAQSPRRVEKVLIGREDAGDTSITETLNAIADEQPEFYDLHYTLERDGIFTIAPGVSPDASYTFTIETGGLTTVTTAPVPFDTDSATTYTAFKAAIEAALPGSTVTTDSVAGTLEINATGKNIVGVTMEVTGGASETTVFDIDFEAGNSIAIDIAFGSGSAADTVLPTVTVPFNTDNATTYGDIETAIESALTGSVVTVDSVGLSVNTSLATADRVSLTYVVTGGTNQAVPTNTAVSPATGTFAPVPLSTPEDNKFRQAGDWALANERIYGYADDNSSARSSPYDAGANPQPCLGAYFKSTTNERSYGIFDKGIVGSDLDAAWAGENLPYGPAMDGSANTWSFKAPKGTNIAPRGYSTSERSNLESNAYNVYVSKRGTNLTLWNRTATGEPIEAIINRDWTVYLIQRNVFTLLLNKRAVPLNDNGMLTVIGQISAAMDEAESKGAIVPGSTTITYPRFDELPEADRNAGIFSGIVVEAKIQRAIQKVKVRFIITA